MSLRLEASAVVRSGFGMKRGFPPSWQLSECGVGAALTGPFI